MPAVSMIRDKLPSAGRACRRLLLILVAVSPPSVTAESYLYSVQTQESSLSTYSMQADGTPRYRGHLGTYKYPGALAIHPGKHFLYTGSKSTDEIMVYAIGADGALTAKPQLLYRTRGRSLFGLVFHPGGRFLYAAARFSGVVALRVDDKTGAVRELSASPYPAQERTRDIAIDPSGRFLYAVNAYSNSVTVYHINQKTGALIPKKDLTVTTGQDQPVARGLELQDMPLTGGGVPYTVAVHPRGTHLFVSNWAGASVSVFAINADNGSLRLVNGKPFPSEINPYIVAVHPSGRYVYVGGWADHKVAGYAFDEGSGTLRPLPGSPWDLQARAPLALHFHRDRMYVVNNWGNSISVARIGDDGVPQQISSIQTRSGPHEIALLELPDRDAGQRQTTALIRAADGRIALWQNGADKVRVTDVGGAVDAWAVAGKDRIAYVGAGKLRVAELAADAKPGLAIRHEYDYTGKPAEMLADLRLGFLYFADKDGNLSVRAINAADGSLQEIGYTPLPLGRNIASLSLDAISRYLFVSREKDNILETFRYRHVHDPIVMDLKIYQGQRRVDYGPRQILADRNGHFVLVGNGRKGGIMVYRHDPQSGIILEQGARFVATGTAPESMSFAADGSRLYSLHRRKGELRIFEFLPVTGELKPVQTLARQGRRLQQVLASANGRELLVLSSDRLAVHQLDADGRVKLTNTLQLPFTAVDMQLISSEP